MSADGAWHPSVDVLIPAYNEEAYIDRCLDLALGQDYAPELTTVWLIDAGSDDATLALARSRAEREPRLRVISGHGRLTTPEALNVGLRESSGDLVARVDAHGFPAPDFLSKAVAALDAAPEDVACVGGRLEQLGETQFARAFALARGSRFGVGASHYAGSAGWEFVDHVAWGVYRRGPLEEVGAFDPAMSYGEDEEVNWRLRRAGHRIILDTAIRFTYVTRPSWRAGFRQYRNYGAGRIRVIERHPDFARPYHFAPAALVAGLTTAVAGSPWSRRARGALATLAAAYSLGSLAAAARATLPKRPQLFAATVACFPLLHIAYGLGSLEQAGRTVVKALWPAADKSADD